MLTCHFLLLAKTAVWVRSRKKPRTVPHEYNKLKRRGKSEGGVEEHCDLIDEEDFERVQQRFKFRTG